MLKLIVDNNEMEALDGRNLLHAMLDSGIFIPSLCFLKGIDKMPASCRLCWVEIEGMEKPALSCTVAAEEGMIVKTDTPAVRRLQKTAFELLLSVHRIECGECPANKRCALQNIARYLKVPLKQKRIEYLNREVSAESGHPFLLYDPYRCVMCERCVNICLKRHGKLFLSFAGRGLKTAISFFGEQDANSIPCDSCYACVEVCPVAALMKRG